MNTKLIENCPGEGSGAACSGIWVGPNATLSGQGVLIAHNERRGS